VNVTRAFNWPGWMMFALLLLLWELGSRINPALQPYLPPVSRILSSLGELILSGQIVSHLMITLVVLPAAAPYIVTGLRISLSIALILVTTAEMIAGSRGLGFFILDQERSMNASNMYAGVILVAGLGYLLNRLFVVCEGYLMNWRRGMLARESI
jgi:ABC-type nitrate/sulfonate/bicarbonate transport system permease component